MGLLERNDCEWNANVGDVPYYALAVHPSLAFVTTPTLAAALGLLLLRFASGQVGCPILSLGESEEEDRIPPLPFTAKTSHRRALRRARSGVPYFL